MPDFTSSLFLGPRPMVGIRQPLTTGKPAALSESGRAQWIANRVALDQGAAAGVVHRSALHALIDCIDLAARPGTALLIDQCAYSLAHTAAAGVVSRGIPLRGYRHHDPTRLARVADEMGLPPVVVTDGWCGGCGRPAPLPTLRRLVEERAGVLIVDDTQAYGILGSLPRAGSPFGNGGGGTFCWWGEVRRRSVVVASLAKAYGGPLAVTTGPADFVGKLRRRGTRWNSSAPTTADLAAAAGALGDHAGNAERRLRLGHLVTRLRAGLTALGCRVIGVPFPVVSAAFADQRRARWVYRLLTDRRIRSLLLASRCRSATLISFAVTAASTRGDIDLVLDAYREAVAVGPGGLRDAIDAGALSA